MRAKVCEKGREAAVLCSVRAAAQIMVLARAASTHASHPRKGDRILIFKPQWLQLVLSGQKTMECRGAAYKSGKYYLGCGGPT